MFSNTVMSVTSHIVQVRGHSITPTVTEINIEGNKDQPSLYHLSFSKSSLPVHILALSDVCVISLLSSLQWRPADQKLFEISGIIYVISGFRRDVDQS